MDKCQFTYLFFSFLLPNCSSLVAGQELIIYGTQQQSNDKSIFSQKKLTVRKIVVNRTHQYSVYYWLLSLENSLLDSLEDIKHLFLAQLGEKEGSLVIGSLLGKARDLSPKIYTPLQASGLSYLFKSATYTTMMAFDLFTSSLTKNQVKLRKGSILLLLAFYAAVASFTPNLLKAFLVSFLSSLSLLLFQRPFSRLYGLVYATGFLLILNPLWFFDFALQLSVVASLAVYFFNSCHLSAFLDNLLFHYDRNHLLMKKVIQTFAFSLYIQFFIQPLVFYYMGIISFISIGCTLIFPVLLSLVSATGVLFLLFRTTPVIGSLIIKLARFGSRIILSFLLFCSTLPVYRSSLSSQNRLFVIMSWYLILILFIIYWSRHREKKQRYKII